MATIWQQYTLNINNGNNKPSMLFVDYNVQPHSLMVHALVIFLVSAINSCSF